MRQLVEMCYNIKLSSRHESGPLPINSQGTASSRKVKLLAEIFRMFDQDGSGEIELDEIARAFKSMGKLTAETRAQLEAHFAFMDSDGSGVVYRKDEHRSLSAISCVEFAIHDTITRHCGKLHPESGTHSKEERFHLFRHFLVIYGPTPSAR